MTSSPKAPIERAVEIFVYAPIGAGISIVRSCSSAGESIVDRGREGFETHRRTIEAQARRFTNIGAASVCFGPNLIKRRLNRRLSELNDEASRLAKQEAAESREAKAAPATAGDVNCSDIVIKAPLDVSALAIPEYDDLSAAQVVERLTGLEVHELEAIGTYEYAHRGRRTILARVNQLIS